MLRDRLELSNPSPPFPLTLQHQSMWGEWDLQNNTAPACVSSPKSSKGNPSPCWWIKDRKHSSFLVNFPMCLFQSQLFEDFFCLFPFKVQYIFFGFLAFYREQYTRDGPGDSALAFHSTESFISFWPKISIDRGCVQLCNSCAIRENHSGLRRLRDIIKPGKSGLGVPSCCLNLP